ncbi:MAG: SPOR domain-containing protein [candidate division Zixibacteria bacterium]
MSVKYIITIIFAFGLLIISQSCTKRTSTVSEPAEQTASGVPLDPMAGAIDREVVPEVYPIYVSAAPDAGDSLVSPVDITYNKFDSLQSQISPTDVYRVQIFTSRLYTEARKEKAIADEIFNLPVYLDYEVPYYKLRVGDFAKREEAENMIPEIRSIGYRSAWVARVNLRVRPAPDIMIDEEPILPTPEADSAKVLEEGVIEDLEDER